MWGTKPDSLDPHRFVNSNVSKSQSFRPWGGGHTLCPGRHLARRSASIFVAVLLSKYDVTVESKSFPKYDWARPSPGVVTVGQGEDLKLQLKPRENAWLHHEAGAFWALNSSIILSSWKRVWLSYAYLIFFVFSEHRSRSCMALLYDQTWAFLYVLTAAGSLSFRQTTIEVPWKMLYNITLSEQGHMKNTYWYRTND